MLCQSHPFLLYYHPAGLMRKHPPTSTPGLNFSLPISTELRSQCFYRPLLSLALPLTLFPTFPPSLPPPTLPCWCKIRAGRDKALASPRWDHPRQVCMCSFRGQPCQGGILSLAAQPLPASASLCQPLPASASLAVVYQTIDRLWTSER